MTRGEKRYEAPSAADDARDADGLSVFSFPQAQGRARDWFTIKEAEQAGDFVSLDRPIQSGMRSPITSPTTRAGAGKAGDRVEATVRAWINPELGGLALVKLTMARIQKWHPRAADNDW